jgi:hypothetical protein
MVYVLLYGVAQESFRIFEAWIILGLVSRYVCIPNPETFYTQGLAKNKEDDKISGTRS